MLHNRLTEQPLNQLWAICSFQTYTTLGVTSGSTGDLISPISTPSSVSQKDPSVLWYSSSPVLEWIFHPEGTYDNNHPMLRLDFSLKLWISAQLVALQPTAHVLTLLRIVRSRFCSRQKTGLGKRCLLVPNLFLLQIPNLVLFVSTCKEQVD